MTQGAEYFADALRLIHATGGQGRIVIFVLLGHFLVWIDVCTDQYGAISCYTVHSKPSLHHESHPE